VFDRDAEWAGLTRFADHPSPDVRLGIVSGRRRQGKTYLLRALAEATGAFFFTATEATAAESLRDLGTALAAHGGSRVPLVPQTWNDAVPALFEAVPDGLIVLDEVPYLARAYPPLPSLLQRALDRGEAKRTRLLLCGSAMSFMGGLLSGSAPLRGRASLELIIQPFDYRTAAAFWGIDEPALALLTHAVVGGTPAYRREFAAGDAPGSLTDFDDWVVRTVLNPQLPLFREARYLLAEESQVRDPALYHGVLAAIAAGNATRGGIGSYIGRKSSDLAHPLAVLEDARLIYPEPDAFHSGRSRYRVAEPLITFYEAVMRPEWGALEAGEAATVWPDLRPRFLSQVVGPHFEGVCRRFARRHAADLFGTRAGQVSAGTVADTAGKTKIEVDVVVFSPAAPGGQRSILSLGEAKWNKVMDVRHLERLTRARELLGAKGHDTSVTTLTCYSGAGFTPELVAAARVERALLIDLDDLYGMR
jgi:AAA+ ATPase superfamily predicted ATPase